MLINSRCVIKYTEIVRKNHFTRIKENEKEKEK